MNDHAQGQKTKQPAEEYDDLPTTPEQLFDILQNLNISYELYHHEAVFTVAESEKIELDIPGTHCRNLFLRDKKKNMFLVVAPHERQIDLKKLPGLIDSGRLSFGSADRLWENLGVRPGSVCPFSIVNDTEHNVKIILDQCMMESEIVNYHPLLNTMTIGLSPQDLLKFIENTNHTPYILDLRDARPEDS
mgnify:CR=1 FL=1